MSQVAILKFVNGSLDEGFSVILQIGENGDRIAYQTLGTLPAAPKIKRYYQQWQTVYRSCGQRTRRIAVSSRLEFPEGQVTNISIQDDCDRASERLRKILNAWLRVESFRPVREGILENLKRTDEIRFVLQTDEQEIVHLPWHLWETIERYPRSEIAFSAATYGRVQNRSTDRSSDKVRILAILGSNEGINLQADHIALRNLPNAEVRFLVKPKRSQLNDQLWAQGWDILFFAGHSTSDPNGETGQIRLNDRESLNLDQIKYALRRALENGLKLAIFNSCDGLGLARNLATLQIPQTIVMKEPVPDRIAQEFLKHFLKAFSGGRSFYLAVREAREKLQGLEDKFPCATWLPTIFQNPAETPPTWSNWCESTKTEASLEIDGVLLEITQKPAAKKTPKRYPSRGSKNTSISRKSHRKNPLVQVQNTIDRVTTLAQQGYKIANVLQENIISILSLICIAGLAGSLGASLGFLLIYRSPLSPWIKYGIFQLQSHLPFGIRLHLEPAILVFAIAGFATVWGLAKMPQLKRYPWVWTPMWVGSAGYSLAWLSWQLGNAKETSTSISRVGAIAVFFVILGLGRGLLEHPLIHGLFAGVCTAIVFPGLVEGKGFDFTPFVRLMLMNSKNPVSSPEWLFWAHIKPLFWCSVRFFGLLGILTGLFLGISRGIGLGYSHLKSE
ncbi:MAG: CHAT domain-containing protein [Geitlerinemataceae cyanobacterium]